MGAQRDELLARVLDEVAAHGLGDRSLRSLADATGTSHRMLLYHFGSRAGLVDAIVRAMEARQRDALAAAAADAAAGSVGDAMRRTWAAVSAPEVAPFVQLFFEAVALASRQGGAAFTGPWLATAADAAAQLGVDPDPVLTRLGVAVMRGLLIDVITGDDPEAATAAVERYIELVEQATP